MMEVRKWRCQGPCFAFALIANAKWPKKSFRNCQIVVLSGLLGGGPLCNLLAIPIFYLLTLVTLLELESGNSFSTFARQFDNRTTGGHTGQRFETPIKDSGSPLRSWSGGRREKFMHSRSMATGAGQPPAPFKFWNVRVCTMAARNDSMHLEPFTVVRDKVLIAMIWCSVCRMSSKRLSLCFSRIWLCDKHTALQMLNGMFTNAQNRCFVSLLVHELMRRIFIPEERAFLFHTYQRRFRIDAQQSSKSESFRPKCCVAGQARHRLILQTKQVSYSLLTSTNKASTPMRTYFTAG